VPYLGNIPILGLLFKTRNQTSAKSNLMIFIRPKIMRDANQAAYETELKYNYMQEQQHPLFHTSPSDQPPLLPGVPPGKLPPFPPPPPPGKDSAQGPATTGGSGATPPSAQPASIPPGTPAPESTATPAGGASAPNDSSPPPQGKP
jgi:general secretion pathway protein D